MNQITMPSLAEMNEQQLQAAAIFDPAAVALERDRRAAFPDDETMFSELAQLQVNLQAGLAAIRNSPSKLLVEETGVLQLLARAVATARGRGVLIDEPTMPVLAPPAPPSGSVTVEE